jgi:type IV secretory pathway VirB2 component (pilin)
VSGTMDNTGDRGAETAHEVAGAAQRAKQSKTFETVARCGWAANGLMHLFIGVIALGLAFGRSGEADQSGAVGQLAKTPGGEVLLWAGLAGGAALALWQVSEAVFGGKRFEGRDRLKYRIKSAGLAVVFAVLAATFASFALGGGTDSGEKSQDASSTLMQAPGGAVLLFLVGAGIVAAGAFYVVKGIRRKFLKDLQVLPAGTLGRAVTWTGMAGYIGKGLALAVLGILFAVAAIRHDPAEATGLDGALKGLRDQPYGGTALTVVAVGLICYGLYLGARARYGKM